MKPQEYDIVVVGAGPAGIAAAAAAATGGGSVALVDDNPRPGGQIWRGGQSTSRSAQRWLKRVEHPRITWLGGTKIIAAPQTGALLAQTATDAFHIRYGRLVLATGARERFLPFPGWTLPGVMGVGGIQALVKGGLPVADKRIVVAGSGPLLLAVAANLRAHGADVRLIAEQATYAQLAGFAPHLASHPTKAVEGLRYGWALRGVPYHPNAWAVAAHGTDALEAVTLRIGERTVTESCDMLAYGLGLVPNLDLPLTCGCAVVHGVVSVDQWQQSSVADIYCAGESTGIGGMDAALVEGLIAGFAASGQPERGRTLFSRRTANQHFAAALDRQFRLRPELATLAAPDTVVCRCEDVTYGELATHTSWRDAKLQTRCGMGPCQGRICGTATDALFGWSQDSVRPPISPARLASFVAGDTTDCRTIV